MSIAVIARKSMSYRILLAEDDRGARRGLAELLRHEGYDVLDVGTLADGLSALDDTSIGLVITDVRLDGYNGLQLLAAGPRPLPAIVVTGFPDAALEAEARQFGAEFLLKPIAPTVLLDVVRRKRFQRPGPPRVHAAARRWVRRPLATRLAARFDRDPARILDVGYGGARLALGRSGSHVLPFTASLTVPDLALSVEMSVVWRKRVDEMTWVFGTAVADVHQPMWRGLVDTVS